MTLEDLCWKYRVNNFKVTFYPGDCVFRVELIKAPTITSMSECVGIGNGKTFDLAAQDAISQMQKERIEKFKKSALLV